MTYTVSHICIILYLHLRAPHAIFSHFNLDAGDRPTPWLSPDFMSSYIPFGNHPLIT